MVSGSSSESVSGPHPRKTALVTGGAKRVGRELALTLARSGMDVAITFRASADEAAETVRAIELLGVRSIALQMDVCSEASVRDAILATVAEFGGLDLLVNNAAIFESASLAEISLERWDAVFETNARGPFLAAREALPHLKAAHGRIVNLGSLGGSHPWATHGHYCSSKAALHMLTQTMAKAFAPEVSVNCVAPGYIEIAGDREVAHFASKTPMGRNGSAEDVAAAVLFFATGPHFITGQILTVDGGLGL
ncbi:SDR family NAD(P)-dependent oxidoreductase [Acidicapsa acidisoli]|uniref:SDR family NAD(P)-dependent oxidoreductase n=1 Tax=Acidicapsa acidisoli TaxID=1615681 RepID=UPI0021E065B8|nr:SDR family NAD(P)-dependent oxidoreductase [Acidicapsa acidisoli]